MLVSGHVTIETANALFQEGLKSPQNSNLVIDFSQLEKVDSAAVSMMLVWVREAQGNNVNLRFAHVPENLSSLAKLYGVAELLAPYIAQ
jgi:phospholipid transport system transporter-binding protein